MFYNAVNGLIKIDDTDMDYICFGNGDKNLVMIPGLGDGLITVKGTAIPFAFMYKEFAKDYRIYVFSRKNKIEEGYSTKDMAIDLAEAMKKIGINKSSIIGVSQGGMIAQHLAINYPNLVDKLVLVVTVAKSNETLNEVVGNWIDMARCGNYKGIMIDTAEKSYTEKAIKKYRLLYPIITRVGKTKDFDRFIIQAKSCINHNSYDELYKINSKTLVIGGDSDKVVGINTSEQIAHIIPNSKLVILKGLGHMAYEEAKDFNTIVLNFLNA